MIKEKKKLLVHRLIWSAVLVVTIALLIKTVVDNEFALSMGSIMYVMCVVFFPSFAIVFWIRALLYSYKMYEYEGKEIIVYAGFYHHYMKVDGEICDEHNTIESFSPIVLSCTLNDATVLSATITLTYRISLKINNQLCKKEKKL